MEKSVAYLSEPAPLLSRPIKPEQISGAEKIVESFTRQGVKHVFLFPGGTIAPILDVVEKQTDIELVCPRNEQGAGYAALAYAKLIGRPAVFMVTSGPGVTNAVTPIADAYYDNIPLVVLTGQVGTADMRQSLPVRQRGFQEVDTVDLVRPITKAAFLVKDVRELPDVMENAFFIAQAGRKGPVVVDLPGNIQRATCAPHEFFPVKKRSAATKTVPKKSVALLARWIKNASRPIILAGGGVIASNAQDELRLLAEHHRIPVVMSLPGIGAYTSTKSLSLGLCGYAGSQYANLAIYNADFLLCIGTTMHMRQTGTLADRTAPQAKIARIDIDHHELAHSRVPLDLAIEADAKDVLSALNAKLSESTFSSNTTTKTWRQTIKGWQSRFPLVPDKDSRGLKPQEVIEIVDRAVRSDEVIVSTGVGQHQIWVPRHFSFDHPKRQLLTSSGHGTMGFDLPAAIGAKIAHPNATVICFVGDGSLQMNIQELATIVDLQLDIKIIVLDNHSLNIVAQFQRQNWQSHPTTGDRYNPDFARIARVYGIRSASVASLAAAKKIIPTMVNRRGPVLINCKIDPKEDLLPMLLGGHTLDDMSFESSF
jgi:acetolactate synthase I/II/III large subunit